MLKHKSHSPLWLGLLLLIATAFTSCLKDDHEVETSAKVKIYNFSFKAHDSIPGLDKVFFTIDQIKGEIYNQDSLPYGSDVTQLLPVMTFYDTPSSWIINDTMEWNGKDSLDFSQPIKFTLWSSDKTTKKDYRISVRVHQVNTQALLWSSLEQTYSPQPALSNMNKKVIVHQGALWLYGYDANDNQPLLYRSSDGGSHWTQEALSGVPVNTRFDEIVTLNGVLYAYVSNRSEVYRSRDAIHWEPQPVSNLQGELITFNGVIDQHLSGIVKDREGYLRFFTTTDFIDYDYSHHYVPNGFPVLYHAQANYTTRTGTDMLVLALGSGIEYSHFDNKFNYAGGYQTNLWSNLVWSTSDGLYWANNTFEQPMNSLTPDDWEVLKDSTTVLGKRLGSSLFACNGRLYLLGGLPYNSIDCVRDLYVSADGGITWKRDNDKNTYPQTFKPRMNASIVVDENNMITLYGGSSIDASYLDAWRCRSPQGEGSGR